MHDVTSQTDWGQVVRCGARCHDAGSNKPARLRVLLIAFLLCATAVFARVVMLEIRDGAEYRAVARRPILRERTLPGVRGRILARDGTLLAHDTPVVSLAVHYRYLEQPADPRWLRAMARARLPRSQRGDPQRRAAAERDVLAERAGLHRRLRQLCELTDEQWNRRNGQIQRQVERIAAGVNHRQAAARDANNDRPPAGEGWWPAVARALAEALRDNGDDARSSRITVAEELDYHVVAEQLPLAMVAEIEAHPNEYPGVRVVESVVRTYPRGDLAAHALGHLGAATADDLSAAEATDNPAIHPDDCLGRAGVERHYESQLRSTRGEVAEWTDRGGRSLWIERRRPPGRGRDLVLSIDVALQQTAERLLDDALSRRLAATEIAKGERAGGAVVVMNVHDGAILAAASAPRFDPNLFSTGDDARLARLLSDAEHPLLDRVTMMQLPPGSVFKTLSAIALLESDVVPLPGAEPEEPLYCRGYLHQPDRQRCLVFRRYGRGHGLMTMADALTQSCNVYFFHYAQEMGAAPLIWWARQTGFGRPTGVDLPGEAAGSLPPIDAVAPDAPQAADALALAIGQGSLTTTPLQIARLMAAVANGGQLVTPHVVDRVGLIETLDPGAGDDEPPYFAPTRPIAGLRDDTLAAVRSGLERVVNDPAGTARATVYLPDVAIAGKTGTAESGAGRTDHAWFAGYVPADRPRWALVVVLEHAGGGAEAAGPVARRIVQKLLSLGYVIPATPRDASGELSGRADQDEWGPVVRGAPFLLPADGAARLVH